MRRDSEVGRAKEKRELRDYQVLLTTLWFCQEPKEKKRRKRKKAGMIQPRGRRKLKRRKV